MESPSPWVAIGAVPHRLSQERRCDTSNRCGRSAENHGDSSVLGHHTRHRSPRLGIDRFNDFPAVDHIEWRYEAGQLPRSKQVLFTLRAPAEVSLSERVGFHQQDAARGKAIPDVVNAGPIEVVEHQDDVELAEIRPRSLEIDLSEIYRDPCLAGRRLSVGQLGRVTVEPNHRGPTAGRSDAVPPSATGKVEHPDTGSDKVIMPDEPGTGSGEGGERRHGH